MALVPFSFGPKSVGGVRHRTPPFFKTKKVGLLGNTASIQFAPWGDPSWTLLAHPCCRPECRREPDWYFDMHVPACFQVQRKGWNPDYYDWLKKLQTPIFMQEAWPEIPMAVRYPIERVLSEARPYFSNHCAWMIALAMTEGVTHIGLWGCQYSHQSERGHQRGSLEYWLGRFEGAGGKIVLPPKWTNLLADPPELYGYQSHDKEGKLVYAGAIDDDPRGKSSEKTNYVDVALTSMFEGKAVATTNTRSYGCTIKYAP